ncbi:MMS19 nucleotide excision repair protein like protein [Habropoda laboriosa]|uniref:MMS19 nucleotide excision repair protein n=1 Tax=Habropoda laboriosa TaxID=597456 RepID=A0A0L7QYI0_9HYME|nr:PREDICTED: MMS19 nucleotide excision repair protein homolog [Habropoda laboriosa]KOC63670.1 MMS19 nucleotide excision repair protein like protein [Habropoda laboriosa]
MALLTSTVFKERFLIAFKENETLNTTCQEIALEIQSGHTKLYTVVEELGPFVTEKDVNIREKGIFALSSILSHLPTDFLNEAELHFITSFYCDRLKDHHSIIPIVLKGILTIVQMNNLPKDSPERLFRVLFDNVPCQSQLVADRRNIYMIFVTLMKSRIEDLKAMGPDFVYGVISAIDGERNPRNLMLLFGILPHFIKEFSLGHLTGEMFDVIECYFPVDFNPSGSEAIGITRDDLAEKLAPCLCAVPEFAEFCIPLIINKLFSSLRVAKLDSLSLLHKGVQTFGVKGLKQHLAELWPALRKEVMPGGDLELKNASLKAVMSVIEVISSDTKLCEDFIDSIIKDTKSSLYVVQQSLFRPSVKLLECVAMVNKESCTQVLKVIVPVLCGQYSTKTSTNDKVILIETLNNFIKIASDNKFHIKDVPELAWMDIPQLYFNEISTQCTELQSKILFGLTIQKAYLNEMHRTQLYDIICSLSKIGNNEIRKLCQSSLLSFTTLYPREISTLIKKKFQLKYDEEETEIQIRELEVLAAVAKTYELGVEVLPRIVSQTNAVNSEISFTALTCLHRLVATKHIDYNVQHYLYNECNIIEKLTTFDINPTDQRFDLILNICRLIVRNLTLEEQQNVVDTYVPILSQQISETDAVLIINILIPLRQNIDLTINLDLLQNLAINSKHLNIRLLMCKCIAVILNKINDNNEYFQNILSYLKAKINNNLNSNIDVEMKKATASLQLWLTKAIITKGSCDVEVFLNELINIFKDDQVGQYIAQEYKILTDRYEDALVNENFCNVKIFYKQRVFEHLIKKNSEFENTSRQNYLTALVQLLEEVSVELLFMHLTKLVPPLIESLSLDNEQLVFSSLITLKPLLETKHVIFSDKAQCFIPRFLKLSVYKTMRVRIAALECLTNYCNYPTILINTYKQDVLEKLAAPIDDPKRLVRKAATQARTRWFLVGAPGGLKEE